MPSDAEIEKIIQSEMRCAAFTDTENFYETLFDCGTSLIDRIYDSLSRGRRALYNKRGKCWKGFPEGKAGEDTYYKPLVDIFNAITNACGNEKTYPLTWINVHNRITDSEWDARMKPNILALIRPSDEGWAEWWRLTLVPAVVKQDDVVNPGLLQTLKYCRQALFEQPDRRFIYGLVVRKTRVTVWHVDRSGALGGKSFDVNKEPKQLIRVIASLATKDPVELGWDKTLNMVTSDPSTSPLQSAPSWEVPSRNHRKHPDNPWDWWTLSMPKPTPALPDEREDFVIFGAISLARAEVICGRATRIWKAWKVSEVAKDVFDRKIYIIKDSWRDARRFSEGELYEQIGRDIPGVASLYSYETVRIDGKLDETINLIRKGLTHSSLPLDLTADQRIQYRDMKQDVYLHLVAPGIGNDLSEPGAKREDAEPRNRVHTRIVLESHGYPARDFSCLEELVGGLHDAVQGHKNCLDKGVLHRDISEGNVLLTEADKPNRGILIDLDYGANILDYHPVLNGARTGTLAFMSAELSDFHHVPYFSKVDGGPPGPIVVQHGLIHDMEAMFWLLCWLSITFAGPGRPIAPKPEDFVSIVRHQLFDGIVFEANAMAKRLVINFADAFEQRILDLVQPYFQPLKPTLQSLWTLLREAYQHRAWDNIHRDILKILEDAEVSVANFLSTLPKHQREAYDEMTRVQRMRREEARFARDLPAAVQEGRARPVGGINGSSTTRGHKRDSSHVNEASSKRSASKRGRAV